MMSLWTYLPICLFQAVAVTTTSCQVEEVVVADTVRTKMAADGKQPREKSESIPSNTIEELTRLEKRRLDVEEERLARD